MPKLPTATATKPAPKPIPPPRKRILTGKIVRQETPAAIVLTETKPVPVMGLNGGMATKSITPTKTPIQKVVEAAKAEKAGQMKDGRVVAAKDNSPADLQRKGLAVALCDFAENHGVNVSDLSVYDDMLVEAGLPKWTDIPAGVGHHAHKLLRDRIDAVIWRCNRPLSEVAPVISPAEHKAMIESPTPVRRATIVPQRVNGVKTDGRPASTGSGAGRTTIFGHPQTKVVMALGKLGWTNVQVKSALKHFGVEPSDASINTFLRSGVRGDRGEVAPLTAAQVAELLEASKGG